MKKQIIKRGILGFPLGICLGYVITIAISLLLNDGEYHSCVPSLIEQCGNELEAVILQTILCGILGSVFSASSMIWELEKWSISKQTGIYFAISAAAMLPIAYFTHWMERTLFGFLLYFGIFIAIFAVIWIIQYLIYRKKIKSLNKQLQTSQFTF
jgi:hypothetical protein